MKWACVFLACIFAHNGYCEVVESVECIGNKWTSNAWLLKQTQLQVGKPICMEQLETNLAWLNQSPFRQINMTISPGAAPDAVNIELITDERFPFRPLGGIDNTGTIATTHTRFFVGFDFMNLWGYTFDQKLSYQYITAANPEHFSGHVGSYFIPFVWKHSLHAYGSWGKAKSTQNGLDFGTNWQVSGRYIVPIHPMYGSFLQEFSFGYDFKKANTGLIFGVNTSSKKYADINQFVARYLLNYEDSDCTLLLDCELFAAPFKMTKDQTDARFQNLRPLAKSKYAYGRARFTTYYDLPAKFSLKGTLAGQIAGTGLLPSEQFSLGGYNAVRGYEEFAFVADTALLASLEIGSQLWGRVKKESLKMLAFVDFGYGALHEAVSGQTSSTWLCGIGPGIRFNYGSYINFRGDLGFPLHKTGTARHGIHAHVAGDFAY